MSKCRWRLIGMSESLFFLTGYMSLIIIIIIDLYTGAVLSAGPCANPTSGWIWTTWKWLEQHSCAPLISLPCCTPRSTWTTFATTWRRSAGTIHGLVGLCFKVLKYWRTLLVQKINWPKPEQQEGWKYPTFLLLANYLTNSWLTLKTKQFAILGLVRFCFCFFCPGVHMQCYHIFKKAIQTSVSIN